MLLKIRYYDSSRGIEPAAFTAGFSYAEEEGLMLLSIAGHEAAVKAISAAGVNGREIQIDCENLLYLSAIWRAKYKILSAKLPGGLLHQVVLHEGFYPHEDTPPRLVLAPDSKPAHEALYEHVSRYYPVPLIPAWSRWLYRRLLEECAVEELSGNIQVLRTNLGEIGLDVLVSEAVASGEITF